MAREFPALGFDPAPGNIDRINTLADNLGTIARDLGEAHTDLVNLGKSEGIWTGSAAQAFSETVEDLPEYLDKAHRSFSDASTALSGWADDLAELQRKAASLEAEAARAAGELKRAQANPDLDLANRSFPIGPELDRARRLLQAAEAEVEKAHRSLEEIRRQARRLFESHGEEAVRVAAALNRAREIAPDTPWIDIGGLFDAIGDFFSDVADTIEGLLADISDALVKLGESLSFLAGVMGTLALATAFIPGVNAVTAAAAAGLSAAATGTKLLAKAGGANVSWGDIGMEALGAFPGGRLGQAAKLGNTGLAGAKTVKIAGGGTLGRTIGGLKDAVTDAVKDTAMSATKNVLRKAKISKINPGDFSSAKDLTRNLRQGNISEIIHDTARQSHLDNVAKLNKLAAKLGGTRPIDPDSASGIVLGTGLGTALDAAKDEVKGWVMDPIKEEFKEHVTDPLKEEFKEHVADPIRKRLD